MQQEVSRFYFCIWSDHVRLIRRPGLGHAAIQLARYIGATVFIATESDAQRDFLVTGYNISSDQSFDVHQMYMAEAIKEKTEGRGLDVVFYASSHGDIARVVNCLSDFGRFVDVSKTSQPTDCGLRFDRSAPNITYARVDIQVSHPECIAPCLLTIRSIWRR